MFTNFAVGWNYAQGIPLSTPKPSYLPEFQHGLVFVIGAAMVLMWVFIRIVTHVLHRLLYPADHITVAPHSQSHRIRRPSLLIGIFILCLILVIGIDPHLITNAKPVHITASNLYSHITMNNSATRGHPFGIDDFGRDLMLETASSTLQTLYPVAIIALLTVIASLGHRGRCIWRRDKVASYWHPLPWGITRWRTGSICLVPCTLYQEYSLFVSSAGLYSVDCRGGDG